MPRRPVLPVDSSGAVGLGDVFIGCSDIDASIVKVPLRHQQAQGQEYQRRPQLAGLPALLTGLDPLSPDLNQGPRLDVALVSVQQVDGKAALCAVGPVYLV